MKPYLLPYWLILLTLLALGGCELKDNQPPDAVVVSLLEDTGASATDRVTRVGTLEVSGVGLKSTWFYSLDRGSSWTAGSGNRFTVPEGAYSYGEVLVYQKDAQGNVSPVTQVEAWEYDASVSAPELSLEEDNGPSSSDYVTNSGGILVAGLVQPFERQLGAYWEYSLDQGINWTRGTGTRFEATPDNYTSGMIQARQVDLAGNRSEVGSLPDTLILTPLPPPYLSLDNDTGVSASDNITFAGQVTIANLNPTARWEYSYDQGTSWLNGSSTLAFQVPEGRYAAGQIQARQLDDLGYPSEAVQLGTLVVDQGATPPAGVLSVDTGSSANDQVTQNGQLEVTLQETGSTWSYSLDNGTTWTAGSGTSFVIPVGTYAAGEVQLRETDVAGNVSAPRLLAFISVDQSTSLPVLQLEDLGADADDQRSRSGQVTVVLTDNATTWRYSADGGRNWSAGTGTQFTLPVANYQVNQILVRQTDLAGNESDNASFPSAVVVETTPPAVLQVTPKDYARVGLSTNSVSVTFSERMDPVLLTTNTTTACSGNLQVSGDGFSTCMPMTAAEASTPDNQTFTVQFADPLVTGTSYRVKVTQTVTDYAGNLMEADYSQQVGFMRPPAMQVAYLKSNGTATLDQLGYAVDVSGETLVASAPFADDGASSNAGAVYVFRDNGTDFSQDSTVLRGGNAGDFFGWSTSLDGQTLAVGAPYDDPSATNNGAVHVFSDGGSSFTSSTSVTDGSGATGDYLGYATAFSGSLLVSGALTVEDNKTGKALVFSGANFTTSVSVSASNASDRDEFGHAVATDGNWIVVGVPKEDSSTTGVQQAADADDSSEGSGAVYVFANNGSLLYYLKADNAEAGDAFGFSVAIDNGTIVVGAPKEDSNETSITTLATLSSKNRSTLGSTNNGVADSGAVYVFKDNGSGLGPYAYLKPDNPGSGYAFGSSVDIQGEHIVVGAPEEASNQTYVTAYGSNAISSPGAGAAYVFKDNGTHIRQYAYLKADNTNTGDKFGSSVAVDNVTVIVGAPFEDGDQASISTQGTRNDEAPDAGAAYVFRIQ